MPKIARTLSDVAVRNLKNPGLHAVGGVTGLRLQVTSAGAKSWILRTTISGKVRELGLGSYSKITLKSARESARNMHELIRQGIDPIEEKRQADLDAKRKRVFTKTFDELADLYIGSVEQQWRNPKSRQQWESSLTAYASPVIGKMNCQDISTNDIIRVLDPIWTVKTETATRVRGRIEKILAYATTRGFRQGDNPARYRGHLDTILPSPEKLKKVKHQPALEYDELPTFMERLRGINSIAARCLEWQILTASRPGEARGALWAELDLVKERWTIPKARMKAGKEHVVPLSKRCLEILKSLPRRVDSSYVFAAVRGGILSDATLGKLVRTLHESEVSLGNRGFVDPSQKNRPVVPHGFRSCFRDYCAESTAFPREVIEHCLAHKLRDRAEAAYQRKTSLPQRVKLMQNFDDYCKSKGVTARDTVYPIGKRNG